MKVRLLGTSACEGIPALFCCCDVCNHAREVGGKEIRSRSSALVDGALKIDLGPDTLCQIHRDRLNATAWDNVVFTHSDDDHFAIRELQYLLPPFLNGHGPKFALGGNDVVLHRIASELAQSELLRTFCLSSFDTSRVGSYDLTGIRAGHLEREDALNLIVDDGKSRFLYATDTGWWPEATWKFLSAMAAPIDLLVIDCSHGMVKNEYPGHLDVEEVLQARDKLVKIGALRPDSMVVTTHHDHRGGATHERLTELLEPQGVVPGYDGMEISLQK
jgi:phosphoribosyl 1,2-cyclic phosphate phosphodiesterase